MEQRVGECVKKNTKIVLGVALLGWIVTLGVFYERSLSSSFTIGGKDAWDRFENGSSRLYPNSWVDTAYTSSHGIPYLFSSTIDRAPYPLNFCFTAIDNDPAVALVIDNLEITYADGSRETVDIPRDGVREEFHLDERGKERGETTYRRANFSFADAIRETWDRVSTSFWCISSLCGRKQVEKYIT